MMRAPIKMVLTLVVVLSLVSCKSISKEAKENLAAPVNCATATQDIATLESEKASNEKRIADGIGSVVPQLAVVGILTGDYKNRVEVATNKYNDDIKAKIAEIRSECGVQ